MPPAKRKSQQRTKEKDLPRGQKRAKTDHTLRKNEYKGWVPSQPGDDEVVRRAFAELQPSILWMKYVRPRRPVVLTGGLNDPELAAVRGWTLDYMSKKAVSFLRSLTSTAACPGSISCGFCLVF